MKPNERSEQEKPTPKDPNDVSEQKPFEKKPGQSTKEGQSPPPPGSDPGDVPEPGKKP